MTTTTDTEHAPSPAATMRRLTRMRKALIALVARHTRPILHRLCEHATEVGENIGFALRARARRAAGHAKRAPQVITCGAAVTIAAAWRKTTTRTRWGKLATLAASVAATGYTVMVFPTLTALTKAEITAAVLAVLFAVGVTAQPKEDHAKLRNIYNGLHTYMHIGQDSRTGLFALDGRVDDVFSHIEWDKEDPTQLRRITVRYDARCRDAESEWRAKVETCLRYRIDQAAEYAFKWNIDSNLLDVRVLPPLPAGVLAQRWEGLAAREFLLGLTDNRATRRKVKVKIGGQTAEHPAMIWDLGRDTDEVHALIQSATGGGKSSLLRSIIFQAIEKGWDVLIIDGKKSGDFDCLAGRRGVLGIVKDLQDIVLHLQWFVREMDARNARTGAIKASGKAATGSTKPLLLAFDELFYVTDACATGRLPTPQKILAGAIVTCRSAGGHIVATTQFLRADQLTTGLARQLKVRVALGAIGEDESRFTFGKKIDIGEIVSLAKGRGWGCPHGTRIWRLQAVNAPDPLDSQLVDEDPATARYMANLIDEVAPRLSGRTRGSDGVSLSDSESETAGVSLSDHPHLIVPLPPLGAGQPAPAERDTQNDTHSEAHPDARSEPQSETEPDAHFRASERQSETEPDAHFRASAGAGIPTQTAPPRVVRSSRSTAPRTRR